MWSRDSIVDYGMNRREAYAAEKTTQDKIYKTKREWNMECLREVAEGLHTRARIIRKGARAFYMLPLILLLMLLRYRRVLKDTPGPQTPDIWTLRRRICVAA